MTGKVLQWIVGTLGVAVFAAQVSYSAEIKPVSGRVVFLGDSITYAGQYVDFVETGLRLARPGADFEVLNLGLPSETVSGLTEPGHAGGAFPRPDLHERLERVLQKTQPKIVIACYGMNDGIYYPFSEQRFEKFKTGISSLHERVTQSGARMIHLTPPVFDPVPLQGKTLPAGRAEYPKPFEGYNQVLDRYADWLVSQSTHGWEVVDIHRPMNEFLATKRKDQPKFTLAPDGVHADRTGHWLMARELLVYLGAPKDFKNLDDADLMLSRYPQGKHVIDVVSKRQGLLKDAWLTEIGHGRPGMSKGLPLAEAQEQAKGLTIPVKTAR